MSMLATYPAESRANLLSIRVVVRLGTVLGCEGVLESPDELLETFDCWLKWVRLALGDRCVAGLNRGDYGLQLLRLHGDAVDVVDHLLSGHSALLDWCGCCEAGDGQKSSGDDGETHGGCCEVNRLIGSRRWKWW